MRALLSFLWSNWRIGLAFAASVAAATGLVGAWVTPRGPVTASQALASMGAALVIGMAAGLSMGSRWSLLVTPVVFAAVFELSRLKIDGPTVDGIHLGSTYGIIAFVVGRVVHGLLVLVPMILGTAYGIWLAACLGKDPSAAMGAAGWTLAGLVTLAVVLLAVFVARPASTHSLAIPVYVVIGEHEARGRAVLAAEWFESLRAPSKEMITFKGSGHRPLFEDPMAFATLMNALLVDTYR